MSEVIERFDSEKDAQGGRFRVKRVHVAGWVLMALALFASSLAIGGSGAVGAAPDDGVFFGAFAQQRGQETEMDAVRALESDLGGTLPLVRSFAKWDSSIDNKFHNFVVDGDRRLMLSIKPKRRDGSEVRWSTIANARPGSRVHDEMVQIARSIKDLDGEVWFTFHHEPEARGGLSYGNNTDFINAWRKIHTIFREQGTDVQWAWTMTSWSFEVATSDRRSAGKWYPGDSYVDFLGSDPYNWGGCRRANEGWTTFERNVQHFMEFGDRHPNKQLVLPEFGSDEGSPGQKGQWLDDARVFLKRPEVASRFAAVVYFHEVKPETPNCDWWLDSSPQSLAAGARFMADPFFHGNGGGIQEPAPTPAPAPTPPPTTATTTTTTTTPPPAPPAEPTPTPGSVPANGLRVVDPVGGCAVDRIDGSDRVTWTPQGDRFTYNVRRDDRWLAKTKNTWHWNQQVTSGSYVVISRNGVDISTMVCRRR